MSKTARRSRIWAVVAVVAGVALAVAIPLALSNENSKGGSRLDARVVSSQSPTPGASDLASPTPWPFAAPPAPTKSTDVSGNGLVFTPEPDKAGDAALSADQAFAKYYGDSTVPSKDSAVYGTLTNELPGTNDFLFKDRPVWGYGLTSHCPPPPVANATPIPESDLCVDWQFLDANTGKQLIESYQQVGSDPAYRSPPAEPSGSSASPTS
jgi:hypothetical protein